MATVLDPYMTLDEIAAELRMSYAFVFKQVSTGKMRAVKLGRAWRVRRSMFKQWEMEQDENADPNLIAAGGGVYGGRRGEQRGSNL